MQSLRNVVGILDKDAMRSRRTIKEAYHERIASSIRMHEFHCTRGDPFSFEYAAPGELLRIVLETSESLQQCYHDSLLLYPCTEASPWHMVIMFDEVTPGNKLQAHNPKKSMNFIFNFLELGAHVLPITAT